jgi:hypothetical protein
MPRESNVPQASVPPHPIVVYASKARVALWTMVGLAFVVIGVFVALHPGDEHPQLTVAAGIAVAAICAAFVPAQVAIFFSDKPQLVVNGAGIWFNSWPNALVLGVPCIPWDNIAFLLSHRHNMQTLLRIALVDPDAVSAQQTRLQQFAFLLLASKVAGFRVITTADGQLETSTEEILERIERQFHHELKHNHIRVIRVQRKKRAQVDDLMGAADEGVRGSGR